MIGQDPELFVSTTAPPPSWTERQWLATCGFLPSQSRTFYWELLLDVSMILGPAALTPRLFDKEDASGGFVEFTLIYFSLVEGWLLYSHHFKGRFNEESRVHMLLQCLIVVFFACGVWILSPCLVDSDDYGEDEDTTTRRYQFFSLTMGLVRLCVFIMFARIAMHAWRASTVCLMMTFFLSNSFMCFTLASISNRSSIRILWGTAVLVESLMEVVLSLCVSRQNYLPTAMAHTLNRFTVIMVAPFGSLFVASLVDPVGPSAESSISIRSISFVVLIMLISLYFQLKGPASDRLDGCHAFVQALALFHLKLMGLALWVMGGVLLVLIPYTADVSTKTTQQHRGDDHLFVQSLGLSFLVLLVLMFAWKSCGGQPYHLSEFVWIMAINMAICLGTFLVPKVVQHHLGEHRQGNSASWTILWCHVGILVFLNLVEALRNRDGPWMSIVSSWILAMTADDDSLASAERHRLLGYRSSGDTLSDSSSLEDYESTYTAV